MTDIIPKIFNPAEKTGRKSKIPSTAPKVVVFMVVVSFLLIRMSIAHIYNQSEKCTHSLSYKLLNLINFDLVI